MVTRPADPGQDGELYPRRQRRDEGRRLRPYRGAAAGRRRRCSRSDDRALLALQGPQAAAVLARPCARRRADMPFMSRQTRDDRRHPGATSRAPATPARTASRSRCRRRDAAKLWRLLLAEPEVKPIGLGARDSLRLEAGLCLYGHDIDTTTSPVEAGLTWSIQKRRREEGGFPGADAHPARARGRPGARARRHQARGPRAGARGHRHRDAGRARGRHGHLRRLRPERQRAGRHGLCRAGRVAPPAPSCISSCAASRCRPRSPPMPFAPHRYKR